MYEIETFQGSRLPVVLNYFPTDSIVGILHSFRDCRQSDD